MGKCRFDGEEGQLYARPQEALAPSNSPTRSFIPFPNSHRTLLGTGHSGSLGLAAITEFRN